jgi:hypothetical protein
MCAKHPPLPHQPTPAIWYIREWRRNAAKGYTHLHVKNATHNAYIREFF